MKRTEIKNLSYSEFFRESNKISSIINYYFKNRSMDIKDFYKELNFLLWGLTSSKNNIEFLKEQQQYICTPFQGFYVEKNKPMFVIDIKFAIELPYNFFEELMGDDDDFKITDITIRILK